MHREKCFQDFTESYIVKKIPSPDSINHKFFNCRSMFDNEIAAYEVVLKSLEEHAAEKRKPLAVNWRRKCFPEYFGSACDFFVLEDLKTKGYQMGNRVQGFNVEECLLVLEKLSFFHALSFSIKSAGSNRFRDLAHSLHETVFCEELAEGIVGVYWENAIKLAVKSLRSRCDPELERATTTLIFYLDSVMSGMMDVVRPEEPFDVICHGDLWANNILIRYVDGQAIDIKMIDLQAMRHSSCVLDVMHLLFTSLETDLLKISLHELVSIYYNFLVLHMKSLDVVPEFTFVELWMEFRKKVQYGVCVACLAFTYVTKQVSDPEPFRVPTKEELSDDSEFEKTYQSLNSIYRDRLYNLVTALIALDLM